MGEGQRPISPATDAAIAGWMRNHGWKVAPAGMDPEARFHVWQEPVGDGKAHALWVDEAMVRNLSPARLLEVLDREGVAEDIRISFKILIEERGADYRVSVVPRRSGEFKAQPE
jgi:hypothetical protein